MSRTFRFLMLNSDKLLATISFCSERTCSFVANDKQLSVYSHRTFIDPDISVSAFTKLLNLEVQTPA